MDFTIKKPLHLIALLGLLGSLALFIGFPLLSIFYPTQIPSLYSPSMTPLQRMTLEISLLLTQFVFVFAGLIVVPLLWYKLVNQLTIKEMFQRLQLKREGLSNALLWGFITVIIAFAITMSIGLLYLSLTKTDPSKFSNIPDLQQLFSMTSLYILVTVQPFCEEFFFRGFLLEKLSKTGKPLLAIITTSLLFGISHLSYTYAYAAIIAVILGILFAVVVSRTKNLYSAIFAHTLINITSLSLYFFGKSYWM